MLSWSMVVDSDGHAAVWLERELVMIRSERTMDGIRTSCSWLIVLIITTRRL